MIDFTYIAQASNSLVIAAGLILLAGGIMLSLITRFVQLRTIPYVFTLLFHSVKQTRQQRADTHSISAHKALFTAMSTTIGIASIVSPIFAIKMGGPGALLGFLLTAIFGSASTFTEVTLALSYRERRADGSIAGGPMQYLAKEFSGALAAWYALSAFVLLVAWSANQSNTIAEILVPYGVPSLLTGILITIAVLVTLFGGIQRVSKIAEKMVPFMFLLFVGGSCWILIRNASALPAILCNMVSEGCSLRAVGSGIMGGGLLYALRWGLLKGIHASEAGIGTAAIPHSMAQVTRPTDQGMLAMVSVWSVCFISTLSGLVVLVSDAWHKPGLGLGINVLIDAFTQHFPTVGPLIIIVSAFLFAFGTILGNSYNGSQCFLYLTGNRHLGVFYSLVGCAIFVGTLIEAPLLWTVVDFFIIPVAVPHIGAIVILAFRKKHLLNDLE